MSKDGVISGPYFPAFGLNTERYDFSGPEITPYLDTFHAGLSIQSGGIDITWKHIVYNILINEWEFKFVYQQNFQLGKKWAVVFF